MPPVPTALVRRPSQLLAGGLRTFVGPGPLDPDLARAQHEAFVGELARLGLALQWLPELPLHPDGVFVEDAALVLDEAAVLAPMGAETRRPEQESVAAALAAHRELVRLDAPCALDGGDVLRLGDVLLVGQSPRTNHAALKRLAHVVLAHGLRVKAVEVAGALHLKTALARLADDLVLANPAWVDLHRLPEDVRVVEVDPREPFAANAFARDGVVLHASAFPRTAERIAAQGLEVRPVELSEILKAEGGPTCLSIVVE